MKEQVVFDVAIQQTFQEMQKDLKQLAFMAKNHGVFNHKEVYRVEKNMMENLKAIEYLMLSQKASLTEQKKRLS
ncbi:hypothetical protein [Bacillus sp. FJAT-47783]|uniref:hypothetical protein n=1 Tax=Bacillus sp. FJAT-47783 TaxID=2922712 RepID=UPI001FAE4B4B|nr:hypothetical protein [Bacillus sp. FJAT-47783]